jgi:hypothetical protein|nr:MAG TPA: hypothetical protein [Caudoviricetes sp.]
MFTKLVSDASSTNVTPFSGVIDSAEHVVIPANEVRSIGTGLSSDRHLVLSLDKCGDSPLDMCELLTTAVPAGREIRVAVLNRGTDPVTIPVGYAFLEFFEI